MTLVHGMFLIYMSTNRCPPSLADGSRGTDSPSFIGTMEALRLPSPFSLPSVVPRLRYRCAAALFLRSGWQQVPRNARTVGHRSALNRSLARRREALPSSRGSLIHICLALGPRLELNLLTNLGCPVSAPVKG